MFDKLDIFNLYYYHYCCENIVVSIIFTFFLWVVPACGFLIDLGWLGFEVSHKF